ncbi:MAG: T9SS type A sorting domain-containing protein [Flavobacteriales bacterium]|nr:T9SS type A sorting domain-containing protein [Flavobacteriales bacterium]
MVEGALDDIQLWNGALNTLNVEEMNDVVTMLYPSPTSDVLNLVLADRPLPGLNLSIVDLTGRTVLMIPTGSQSGNRHQLDVHGLADGHYLLQVRWEGGHTTQRFSILR